MRNLILILSLLFSFTVYGQVKITDLPDQTNADIVGTDVVPMVDVGGPTTKKITFTQLDLRWLSSVLGSVTTGLVYDDQAYAEFQELSANGGNYVRLRAPASMSADVVLTLPPDDGDADEVLTTDGNGVLRWDTGGGGGSGLPTTGGSMTGNIILENRTAIELEEDNGSGSNKITLRAAQSVTSDYIINLPGGQGAPYSLLQNSGTSGNLQFGNDVNALNARDRGFIRWSEDNVNGTDSVSVYAPTALASSYNLIWPGDDGDSGECLQTNGTGTLTWDTCGGGGGAVDSVFTRTGAVVAATSDYDAIQVDNTPAGAISATNVQAALNELDTEKVPLAGSVTISGFLQMGDENGVFFQEDTGNGINYVAFKAPASVTADALFTLPDGDGANGECLTTNGSLVLDWGPCNGVGSGLPTSGGTMTGNIDMDNATKIRFYETDANGSHYIQLGASNSIGSTFELTLPSSAGTVGQFLGTSGSGILNWTNVVSFIDFDNQASAFFRELDVNGSSYVQLRSPAALGANVTLTLPPNDGDADQVLTTDGAGVLTWEDGGGGGGGADVGLYCTWTWEQASNATWAFTSTSFVDPAVDNDFADPAVVTSAIATAASASCSAPGTKVPQAVTTDLPAGEYRVESNFPATYDGASRCYYRITDSTTSSIGVYIGDIAGVEGDADPAMNVVYGSTTSATFKMQAAKPSGSQCFIPMNVDSGVRQGQIRLYRVR